MGERTWSDYLGMSTIVDGNRVTCGPKVVQHD